MWFWPSFVVAALFALAQGCMLLAFVLAIGRMTERSEQQRRMAEPERWPFAGSPALPLEAEELRTGEKVALAEWLRGAPTLVLFARGGTPARLLCAVGDLQHRVPGALRVLLVVGSPDANIAEELGRHPDLLVIGDPHGRLDACPELSEGVLGVMVGEDGLIEARSPLTCAEAVWRLVTGAPPREGPAPSHSMAAEAQERAPALAM